MRALLREAAFIFLVKLCVRLITLLIQAPSPHSFFTFQNTGAGPFQRIADAHCSTPRAACSGPTE